MLSNRDIQQRVEELLDSGDTDASAVLQLSGYKEHYLSLLSFKASNHESRQQVQSRTVHTLSRGLLQLDDDPDVRLALLLSDELKLDEIHCVELLLQAHQERGDLSAETAAGIYFDERKALLASLHRLLQFHAAELDSTAEPDAGGVSSREGFFQFTRDLLRARDSSGRSVLLCRMVDLIKDASLEASASSPLRSVRDSTGQMVSRSSLVQRERSQLCEMLMYAVFIAKAESLISVPDVERLAELMHFLALKLSNLQGTSAASASSLSEHRSDVFTMLQHTTTACSALLISLSPSMVSCADPEAERSTLGSIARSAQVSAALHLSETTGFHHLASLAWGLLQTEHGPDKPAGRERTLQSLSAGCLSFLAAEVLSSVPFMDDDLQPQETVARVSLSLLLRLMAEEEELIYDDLVSGRIGKVTAGPVGSSGGGAADGSENGDSIASLLHVLELVLRLRPELALNPDLRDPKLEVFLENIPFGGCMQTPEVLVAYLRVLKSVSHGEMGARMVFHQLMHPHMPEQLSWGKLFTVMLKYCHWFQPTGDGAEDGSAALQGSGGEVKFMSERDMLGLVAYLELFRTMLEEGQKEEVLTWVRQLEDKMSLRPLYEVLFQLMCHRVPHELKAALMQAIGAFATSAEAAAEIWERLKSTAIYEPPGSDVSMAGVAPVAMRYDLTYQLAEIEERSEVYPEIRAFMQLLNKLWEASGGELLDFGRPYSHYTRFVQDVIVGQLGARSYKVKREKWELAETGFRHMRTTLEALRATADASGAVAANGAGFRAPGVGVMLDMLKEGRSMRTVLGVAMTGPDRLARERQGSDQGAALEGAVLASLQLLVSALEAEPQLAKALAAAGLLDRDQGMVNVLKADARRLAVLTDYIRYPYCDDIQAEALRIFKALAASLPNLVDLLARGSGMSTMYLEELQQPRSVEAAAVLESSLHRPPAAGADAGADEQDPRASLLLQLLLDTSGLPTPSVAQLLLGLPLDEDSAMREPRNPFLGYSCLTVVLKAAADANLPTKRPRLYEQVTELVYLLAANEHTRPSVLPVLRGPQCTMLVSQLDAVVCAPLPEASPDRAASLHARAWLLQLYALELHVADTAIPAHTESIRRLLAELFDPAAANDSGTAAGIVPMEQRRARMLEVLELAIYPLSEPNNSTSRAEVRRLQEEMQLSDLLYSSKPSAEGGVHTLSERGCSVIDIPAFISQVMERYSRISGSYSGSGAVTDEDLRSACREMVSLAYALNEFQEESIAQHSLVSSWQELVEVAFSARYDFLSMPAPAQLLALPGGGEDDSMAIVLSSGAPGEGADGATSAETSELLHEVLQAALLALDRLLGLGLDRLAPALCSTAQILLSRLQEEGARLGVGGPGQGGLLPTTWAPSRCHDVLSQILSLLERGRRNEAVRSRLYGSLLVYLQICKGPPMRQWPQAVVDAVLEGSSRRHRVAAIDATQAELEQGNAILLQNHAQQLIEMLGADALAGKEANRALVFRLLSSLAAADPVVANEVHRADLPRNILDALAQGTASALSLPARQSQAACVVIEAQLGLLQALCLAGPAHDRSATAQRIFSIGALRCISGCRALSTQVEELRGSSGFGPLSLRARVARIVRPALRLVDCIVAALPASHHVASEALQVVASQHRLLARLLAEVPRGGEAEIDQGCLVAGLLARLAPHLFCSEGALRYKARALDERLWELGRVFLSIDEDAVHPDSETHNPVAAAILESKRQACSLFAVEIRLAHSVWGSDTLDLFFAD